MGQKQSLCIQQ